MKVGDLIRDKNYADLAVIIGEKPEQFTVYYMPAKTNMYASRGGAIIDEDVKELGLHFRVISPAKEI